MPDGSIERFGPNDAVFALASITKLYTAMAALVATRKAHSTSTTHSTRSDSALPTSSPTAPASRDERRSLAPPAARRIYSTAAYDILADRITDRAGMPFDRYAAEAVARLLEHAAGDLRDRPVPGRRVRLTMFSPCSGRGRADPRR